MHIFGKDLGKEELLKKVGDISQLGGIKLYEFIDGLERGVRAADIHSPCGIYMTVVIERGMDISNLFFNSTPIAWRSANRETSPIYYESEGFGWLRTFFGGLLTTCGLTAMGMPGIDRGEEFGLHGRISNTPAENICTSTKWLNDECVMEILGKVRETKVFGDKLELSRKITTYMSTPKIIIEDHIENIGFTESPLMILYHINIGYPVLDKTSKLIEGKAKVVPRDEEAKKGFDKFSEFSDPVKGYKEQVFFHDIEADVDGNSHIAIINTEFNNGEGMGISLAFNKENLPYLVQWKQVGEGEYACGIEPSNSFPRGRAIEREEGKLVFIKPGEIKKYRIEFNILKSNKEIEQFRKTL
ncbi:MAG: aldose 1-epimerase family protein [Candidatus Humimicrobiaceae bacterium]